MLGVRLNVEPSNGGHTVVRAATGCGWVCTTCRMRSVKKWRLTTKKCEGGKKKTWAWASHSRTGEALPERAKHGHVLLKSGTILWCSTCGAFAETRANRLRSACLGPPPQQHGSGGVRSQLNRLRAGIHPVTRARLPQATWADGRPLRLMGGYARRLKVSEVVDEHFVTYVPEESPASMRKDGGKSADEKRRLLVGRTRCRELSAARMVRRQRKKKCELEAEKLIATFLNGDEVSVESDTSDAEFWCKLDNRDWDTPLSMRPVDVHCGEPVRYGGGSKASRLHWLAASCSKVG